MKGFKDSSNKFHPITQSKGVRKSRDQKAKTQGIRLQRIFQDDPDAIPKLEKKLERLEKEKAYWKGLKPLPRTYQANEPDGAKRSFMLPNLNANIRTVRQKIELIKSRQERNIGLERKTTFKDGRKVFFYQEVERKARDVLDPDLDLIIEHQEKEFEKGLKEYDFKNPKLRNKEWDVSITYEGGFSEEYFSFSAGIKGTDKSVTYRSFLSNFDWSEGLEEDVQKRIEKDDVFAQKLYDIWLADSFDTVADGFFEQLVDAIDDELK